MENAERLPVHSLQKCIDYILITNFDALIIIYS